MGACDVGPQPPRSSWSWASRLLDSCSSSASSLDSLHNLLRRSDSKASVRPSCCGVYWRSRLVVGSSALVLYNACLAFLSASCGSLDCYCDDKFPLMKVQPLWVTWLVGLASGVVAVFLLTKAWSRHLCKAAAMTLFNWAAIVSFAVAEALRCTLDDGHMTSSLSLFGICASGLTLWLLIELVLDRIVALETSMLCYLGSAKLQVLANITLVLSFLACIVSLFVLFLPMSMDKHLLQISKVLMGVAFVVLIRFAWLATVAFCKPLGIIQRSAGKLADTEREEAKKSIRFLHRQLMGLLLSVGLSVPRVVMGNFVYSLQDPLEGLVTFYHVLTSADIVGNAVGAMLLSGALGARPPHPQLLANRERRRDRQAAAHLAYEPCQDPAWHAKVVELAGRALSLGALLDFYASLPSHMQHYAPDRHTTRDVVRQAIIPLTQADSCALATTMMGGAYVRPKKMVTHSWSNLFRDLVAAVVADALGDCAFGSVAYLLDHNLEGLVSVLRKGGKLEETYWICAFSINQHRSICSLDLPGEVDPVTSQIYPICGCGNPKFFNSCPPLRWDGKSVECEMNKFDDMMAYLAATDKDFQHVIAVDARFQTFTRAWVVAEIARGHNMGVPQHLKLRSASTLREHAGDLRHLDVRCMRASRPEDAIEILAGIPDKEAFNRHLQSLIFDEHSGLLAEWKGRDSAKKMVRAGRLARLISISEHELVV